MCCPCILRVVMDIICCSAAATVLQEAQQQDEMYLNIRPLSGSDGWEALVWALRCHNLPVGLHALHAMGACIADDTEVAVLVWSGHHASTLMLLPGRR